MFSKKVKISCFNQKKKNNKNIKKLFFEILQKRKKDYKVIDTFSNKYRYSYNQKKSLNIRNIKQYVFSD